MFTPACKSRVFVSLLGIYVLVNTSLYAQTVVSSFSMSGTVVGSSTQTASGTISISRATGDDGDVDVEVGSDGPITITCPAMNGDFCVVPAGASGTQATGTPGWTSQQVVVTVFAAVYGGGDGGQTGSVTVVPPSISLSVSPNTLVGGTSQSATGTVSVNATPSGEWVVNIGCSGPISCPSSVYIGGTDLLPKNRTGLDMILYCGRGMEDEPE